MKTLLKSMHVKNGTVSADSAAADDDDDDYQDKATLEGDQLKHTFVSVLTSFRTVLLAPIKVKR